MADSAHQRNASRVKHGGWSFLHGERALRRRTGLDGRRRHRGRWTRWRRSLLGLNNRRRHGRGRLHLLRLDGRGQNSVPLHVGRRRLPDCGVVQCIEGVAGLLFALGDLGCETGAASRILHTQKCILAHGGVEQSFIGEEPSFLAQQLGHREDAGIRLGRRRIIVVDGAVGLEHSIVGCPGALRLGICFQRLA